MKSKFTGDIWGMIGINLLSVLISTVTLGSAMPWAVCMRLRWYTKHTIVDGKRLVFDGKGVQLFGYYVIWLLLSLIPIGAYICASLMLDLQLVYLICLIWASAMPWLIYSLYMPVKFQRWGVRHTHMDNYFGRDNMEYPEREGCPCYGYDNYRDPEYYRRDNYRGPEYYRRDNYRRGDRRANKYRRYY